MKGIISVKTVIQYFCFPDRSIKVGTSWISRKGGILEKGGMTPLTNYVSHFLETGKRELEKYGNRVQTSVDNTVMTCVMLSSLKDHLKSKNTFFIM